MQSLVCILCMCSQHFCLRWRQCHASGECRGRPGITHLAATRMLQRSSLFGLITYIGSFVFAPFGPWYPTTKAPSYPYQSLWNPWWKETLNSFCNKQSKHIEAMNSEVHQVSFSGRREFLASSIRPPWALNALHPPRLHTRRRQALRHFVAKFLNHISLISAQCLGKFASLCKKLKFATRGGKDELLDVPYTRYKMFSL